MALKLYVSVAKRLQPKVRKFFWANSYVSRSYRGKADRGGGRGIAPPPHTKQGSKSYSINNIASVNFYIY